MNRSLIASLSAVLLLASAADAHARRHVPAGPALTLTETCPLVDQEPGTPPAQVYGVTTVATGLTPGELVGVKFSFDGADGGSQGMQADAAGVADFGGAGNFTPITLVEVSAFRDPDGDGALGAGETIFATARLSRPCLPAVKPVNRSQCRKGGWRYFGFKHKRDCTRFVRHGHQP